MNLRFISAAALILTGSLAVGLGSCSGSSKEDPDATVVNIEKGVAPAVSSEATSPAMTTDMGLQGEMEMTPAETSEETSVKDEEATSQGEQEAETGSDQKAGE